MLSLGMSACSQNTTATSLSSPSIVESSTLTTAQTVVAPTNPASIRLIATVNATTFTHESECEHAAFWETNESQTIALWLFLPLGDERRGLPTSRGRGSGCRSCRCRLRR